MKRMLPARGWRKSACRFTVRVVRSDDALRKAVAIRQAAYARHLPTFAATLGAPEPNDRDEDSLVLLAESRLDGSPVGAMRIQTNSFRDLPIAHSVKLPTWLLREKAWPRRHGSALRQAAPAASSRGVLCKAFYLYCLAENIEWMVVAARPPLDRPYEAALFQDVYPGELIPLRQATISRIVCSRSKLEQQKNGGLRQAIRSRNSWCKHGTPILT